MNSIAIISIVVIALLTIIVFGLAWLAWNSCLKSYKLEVEAGKHDKEIFNEYHSKKKSKSGLIGIILSYSALVLLSGLFMMGIVYKVKGENLSINNQTVLVIKSGSMSDYYNEELATEYTNYPTYHFDVGDICVFESLTDETELVKGEVYGYKYKDIVITHRLIDIHEDWYEFRGDNNSISDPYCVKGESIKYHYTGHKIPGVGAFVLYAQSYFGIWSLAGIIGVAVSSEVVCHKLEKINKERDKVLSISEEKPAEENLVDIKLDLEKEEFSQAIALVLELKKQAKPVKEDPFWKAAKEVWPQLNKEPAAEAPSKTHEEEEGAKDEK